MNLYRVTFEDGTVTIVRASNREDARTLACHITNRGDEGAHIKQCKRYVRTDLIDLLLGCQINSRIANELADDANTGNVATFRDAADRMFEITVDGLFFIVSAA